MTEEGEPERFRGLLYIPDYENEVIVLFGMLLQYLDEDFIVDTFTGDFPDCTAIRNGKRIGIEFETRSSHFFDHKHDRDPRLARCDMIVSWENNLESLLMVKGKGKASGIEKTIEVLELSRIVKEKKLGLVLKGPRPSPPGEWSKEAFFHRLEGNVEKKRYHWVQELIEICEGSNEFIMAPGKGKKKASVGFHIRKWLSRGIGVPTPIQFNESGSCLFDCKDMPEQIATELRKRTNAPKRKSGEWRQWYETKVDDEESFKMLKGALEWLTHSI